MAKEVLFFVDACRRRKLHTNSRSTAAEIQPLDCNNDTTKQQELGYSCIVTKSSCHSLIDFIAVLVTKQQEVSSINKAEEFFFCLVLGCFFLCCLLGFYFFIFYFFFFSIILIYISRHRVLLPNHSLVPDSLYLGTCLTARMNRHLFMCRHCLSGIQSFRQNTHPSLYLIQGFNRVPASRMQAIVP